MEWRDMTASAIVKMRLYTSVLPCELRRFAHNSGRVADSASKRGGNHSRRVHCRTGVAC
jgi:hypothetical protein